VLPRVALRLQPTALPCGAALLPPRAYCTSALDRFARAPALRADDLLIAAAGPLTHAPQAAVWGIAFAIAHAAHSVGWIWCAQAAAAAQTPPDGACVVR
jgi:hypothetical protein